VIGVCCGHPDDSSWENVHKSGASTINTAREDMHFAKKDLCHRRADTPAGAVGVSYGGGQSVRLLAPSHILPLTGHRLGSRQPRQLWHQCVDFCIPPQ
jgi:hypothetical protein